MVRATTRAAEAGINQYRPTRPFAGKVDYFLAATDTRRHAKKRIERVVTGQRRVALVGAPLTAGDISITIPYRPAIKARDVLLRVASLDAVAQDLQGLIATRVLPQTDIIEISVFGTDPVRVQDEANDLAQVYGDYSKEQGLITAAARTAFIRTALTEQGQQLAQAQDSLRRFQEEVNEVRAGMECGIRIDGFGDFQVGDSIECYAVERVAQKL